MTAPIPNATIPKGVDTRDKPQYDPDFTDTVITATGPKADPRFATVMASLIRHVHDFAREVDLTVDEWMAGVDLINRAGQMSNDRRNEGQLVCDVIGLESYVSLVRLSSFIFAARLLE